MLDPDPERSREGGGGAAGGGGGGGGGAVSQKKFSALRVSVQSKNKGKPSPGSATVYFFGYMIYIFWKV